MERCLQIVDNVITWLSFSGMSGDRHTFKAVTFFLPDQVNFFLNRFIQNNPVNFTMNEGNSTWCFGVFLL